MDRRQALALLKLSEKAAARPGRIEERLALLRESLGARDPERLATVEAAAELLLHPEGRPGRATRALSGLRALGPRKLVLLAGLVLALGLRYVWPWLHPDAALERVPALVRELAQATPGRPLEELEGRAGRVLALAERSLGALGEAPGTRGERLRARWRVELDELLGVLLERAMHEGRRGHPDETRKALALYRRVHDLAGGARGVEAGR